jgi:creatinine amidohydrolase
MSLDRYSEVKTLPEMSWWEVKEALKQTDIVLVPVGSVENHGPHCPLDSDNIKNLEFVRRTSKKLEENGIKNVFGPNIPFGYAPNHMHFSGTISLSVSTFHNLIKEVCLSLVKHGFKRLVLFVGHGGNHPGMRLAARELRDETEARFFVINYHPLYGPLYTDISKAERPWFAADAEWHQGDFGTSMLLATRPDLVYMERARKRYSDFMQKKKENVGLGPSLDDWLLYDTKDFAGEDYGAVGDALVASAERGHEIFERVTDQITAFLVAELKTSKLV